MAKYRVGNFRVFESVFLVKKHKPHLIRSYYKAVLLLGIVARLTKTPFVGAISGLGPAFSLSWKSRLRLEIILYKFIF